MKQTDYQILPDQDLSETQIYVTMQTYNRHAEDYAKRWEWHPTTIKEITKYNIKPFQKYLKKNSNILIAGCQTGRDYSLFSKTGHSCIGTEFSYGLLAQAVKKLPHGLFIRLDARQLPFMPESFDAVYADALCFVPKKNLSDVLKDFKIFLKPKGLLYLSLKLGQGNVLLMQDLKGKRYFTLYRQSEIKTALKTAGFKIEWSATSPHTDPSLPKWFSLIARKK